jgi:hypothetical protein
LFSIAASIVIGSNLSTPGATAGEDVGQIVPIRIELPAVRLPIGPILDANLLPDGRIATIGYVRDSRDTYIRVFDPRTGSDDLYVEPVAGGLQPVENIERFVAIAGDSIFFYGIKARLLRAPGVSQDTGLQEALSNETPKHLTRLQGYDLSGMKRVSGSMASAGDAILVGWWEGDSAKLRAGDCGDGAIVTRRASDGREIWRWQDVPGRFGSPDDMVVLTDGTILVRVDWGAVPGRGSSGCFKNSTGIVALAADGREISRLDLSSFACIGPLSRSADGREAVAIVQTDEAPYAIIRLGMKEEQIRLRRLDLPEKIPDVGCQQTVAASMMQGGYRIVAPRGGSMAFDETGHRLESNPFPADRGMTCAGHGDQGLICWKGNDVAILPLTVASPPPAVAWRLPAAIAHADGSPAIQHIERLPDGRLAVIGATDRSEFVSFQILEPNGGVVFSSMLEAGFATWPHHAVAAVENAVFVSMRYGDLWHLSSNGQRDEKLDPSGLDEPVWWNGVLPVGNDVDVMGWEFDDEPGSCGKGARVARLSSEGTTAWVWRDDPAGIRFPADMISLGDGSLLVLLEEQPSLDLIDLIGEETSFCYEGRQSHLVLLGPDGKELDRIILPEGLKLGPFSRSGDREVAAVALQQGFDPDLVVTVSVDNDRILTKEVPLLAPLPMTRATAIATAMSGGYRLLLRSHVLTFDPAGHLVARQRRISTADRCEMVADQGDFCWSADRIFFQPLQ